MKKNCNSDANQVGSSKKAPKWVLFCGVRQTFSYPGIASPFQVWYLSSKLF
ncbi:transcriptional regulator [Buttiauxella sp. 3AFRM03]|nr:transcriptional regulator [Buttiauxella sp. 3AFRM03]